METNGYYLIVHAKTNIEVANIMVSLYKKYPAHKLALSRKNVAAYNVQQAVEKLIKAIILNQNIYAQTEKWYRSHDIRQLIKTARLKGFIVPIPRDIFVKADILTNWVSKTRYGDGKGINVRTIESILLTVQMWITNFKI